jgi:hypothetical protein
VIKSTIGAHLATVGLDQRDFGVLQPAVHGLALAGHGHKRNNPARFAASPEFWAFFQTHRL